MLHNADGMTERVCQKLALHPTSRCAAVEAIETAVARAADGGLQLRYRVRGEIPRLSLPAPARPVRGDGLWQHSCFEAFLRADDKDGYLEFNFAPSGRWACYRFAGRRSGRSEPVVTAPVIETSREARAFTMDVILPAGAMPGLADAPALHAGLAAVIEDAGGTLSWWALVHGGERPDFHDPATFTLALPAR